MIRSWLESCRARGMALGLDSTRTLLARLGSPEERLPALHVAGSNGKGTACAITTAALILAGHRVGTFTSPHVARIEERIRIDGVPINGLEFDLAMQAVREASEGRTFEWQKGTACETPEGSVVSDADVGPSLVPIEGVVLPTVHPTFFEATYLAGMVAFVEFGIDVAVLEVGLGGRLDATNTCLPVGSLITSLSLEHSEILGDSLTKVAVEKAGIARVGVPLVLAQPEDSEVLAALRQAIPSPDSCHIVSIGEEVGFRHEAALLAKELLTRSGFAEAAEHVAQAVERFRWPARMQSIRDEVGIFPVEVILDSAHNPSAMKRSLPSFEAKLDDRRWGLLIGSSPQFDLDGFLTPIGDLASRSSPLLVVCTEPVGGRHPAIPVLGLVESVAAVLPPGTPTVGLADPREAWKALVTALAAAGGVDATVGLSTGSLYLQGNILTHTGADSDEDLSILGQGPSTES